MLINKFTSGFVVQTYDPETKKWISQEFIASEEVYFEYASTGLPAPEFDDELMMNMVQPSQAYPDGDE